MTYDEVYDSNEYELIHSISNYDMELIAMRDRIIELHDNNSMTDEEFHFYCAVLLQEYATRYPIELRKAKR